MPALGEPPICSTHHAAAATSTTAAATATRVAACVSGQPKTMVLPQAQRHWQAAFAPLLGQNTLLRLDFFLHLEGAMNKRSQLEALAQLFPNVASLCTYQQAAHTVSVYPGTPGEQGRPVNRTSPLLEHFFGQHQEVTRVSCPPSECLNVGGQVCVAAGYEQAVKWRGCLRDIERTERQTARRYDFVLRVRPDLEFGSSLPEASQWRLLRKDVVMPLVAIDSMCCGGRPHGNPTPCVADGEEKAFLRLGTKVSKQVCFTDDALALVPRPAADAYFGIADEYEQCIPPRPLIDGSCFGRWLWMECRVLNALSRLNLSFTEFPATRPRWAFVTLEGPSNEPTVGRRKGVAAVWGGPGNLPEHDLFGADLSPSSFARGALRGHHTRASQQDLESLRSQRTRAGAGTRTHAS